MINKELEGFSRKLCLDTRRSLYRERNKPGGHYLNEELKITSGLEKPMLAVYHMSQVLDYIGFAWKFVCSHCWFFAVLILHLSKRFS